MNCGHCKYWKLFAKAGRRTDIDESRGICKRFPPVLDPNELGESTDDPNLWVQPVTEESEGCGEYQSRLSV